ncbi:hypothetical protein H0H87_011699, partial [Tephrocybe sp. NHM501043]
RERLPLQTEARETYSEHQASFADIYGRSAFAAKVREDLENQASVTWVSYLGFEGHESHDVATAYLKEGLYGGFLTFGVKGGSVTADKVVDNLKLANDLANLGDTKTLVIRPSGTAHGTTLKESAHNNSESEAASAMIRVSVGIETIDDIITDFRNALEQIHVE